jgi:hypothetical protein
VLRHAIRDGMVHPPSDPPPPSDEMVVGSSKKNYSVRDDFEDSSSYDIVTTTLYAVGETVTIWVDDDIPIDFDDGCDGTVDEYASSGDANGFDNCDLQTIADIVDTNILPNLESYFGEPSDIDENGFISVVITGKINRLPRTAADEDIANSFIGSYADPEVDLNEYSETNPITNEQEVVFVFAPDPFGYLNPNALVSINEYTDVELLAQITKSFFSLISYNQHVIVNEGDVETTWVKQGLAYLAVDLTGFGAALYRTAWHALDVSHISSLVQTGDSGAISTTWYGNQYLFFRWLADVYGTDILASMVQTDLTGEDNIIDATGLSMDELVSGWQIALLVADENDSDGFPILPGKEYPQYAQASFISAPVSSPSPGDLYGANGYQQGISVNGANFYYEGGDTSVPSEIVSRQVLLNHADEFIYAYGQPFYGYISSSWATQVVRVTGIPYENATILVRANGLDLNVVAIRWNDPEETDILVENSISPTDQSNLAFLPLPSDKSTIHGLGELTEPGETFIYTEKGWESSPVSDTDRWTLDLTDRPTGQPVNVAIWLDRQYSDPVGSIAMVNPWVAVLPAEYIPNPTPSGVSSDSCSSGTLDWEYPSSVLTYLYYQLFFSAESYSGAGTGTSEEADDSFDPCGAAEDKATLECDLDWDLDNVSDENEPQPVTFLEQVQVMQCTLEDGALDGVSPLTPAIFDIDERDEDDYSGYSRRYNLGGNTTDSGEGAYLTTILSGGAEYVIVVGGDTGYYTLNVQEYY